MSKIAKQDAYLQELIDANKVEIKEKTCWNCQNTNKEGICKFILNNETNWYTLLLDYAKQLPETDTFYQDGGVGAICPFYQPIMIENCANCKKEINQPEHLHKLWGNVFHGNSVPVCSIECQKIINKQAVKEEEQERKALQEIEVYEREKFLNDTYEMTDEDYRIADMAYDAARERRYTQRISRF